MTKAQPRPDPRPMSGHQCFNDHIKRFGVPPPSPFAASDPYGSDETDRDPGGGGSSGSSTGTGPSSDSSGSQYDPIVQDLLRDLPDADRPVARELAQQTARTVKWISTTFAKLEELLPESGGPGVDLAVLERIAKLQKSLGENLSRQMLVLELLKVRQRVAVQAEPIGSLRRRRARAA